ncbi:MAG: ferrous iron transport protein B, partial [Chitinivibrionales bacterium]|nr:ferrous iron transport protein B [Chitinivibrionales bacterium]MBD3356278.1 ferrous iron transport protein B [Chitinivibrionales bacterium]
EDTGYMARTAFIMDKVMHTVGLHGKSFIPMLIGMGCNVPAILATRTLESERDRIKTILLVPLISCSARLPVYVLFAGALFPKHAGNVVFLFQFGLGTLAFFLIGSIFAKTLFKGKEHPFVMELPPYRLPTFRSVVIHMWERGKHYLKKMGGVVLVFSVLLWFLGAFPRDHVAESAYEARIEQVRTDQSLTEERRGKRIADLKNDKQARRVENSYIGRLGKTLEPAVEPLGFDWRGAVSLVTGFVAKEIVVSSMGVLYAVGADQTGESESLQRVVAQHFTPLTALAFMLFVLLYTPCVVAVVTVVRELGSWRWSIFAVGYQIAVAWLAAFIVYQGGKLIGLT